MPDMDMILSLIAQLPPIVSIMIGGFGVSVAGWIYYRKIQLEERVSASSIQKMQVTSLIEQIEMLSADLILARHQMRQLHEQNVQLMAELREANQRISAMEAAMDRRREHTRWDDPIRLNSTEESTNQVNGIRD